MAFWAPILQFVGLAIPAVAPVIAPLAVVPVVAPLVAATTPTAPLVAVAATVAAVEKFQRTETQEESKSQDENST
nr:hypothetical protein CFP56_23390 [Quercus suber]